MWSQTGSIKLFSYCCERAGYNERIIITPLAEEMITSWTRVLPPLKDQDCRAENWRKLSGREEGGRWCWWHLQTSGLLAGASTTSRCLRVRKPLQDISGPGILLVLVFVLTEVRLTDTSGQPGGTWLWLRVVICLHHNR